MGESGTEGQRVKWDNRYRGRAETPAPARVLTDYAHLLPNAGLALDLACGLGANALWLARHGFDTVAWDLSPVAIGRLMRSAAGLPLCAEARDVVALPPASGTFDVIVITRFLERGLCNAVAAALRPRGLLFYQTFTRARVDDIGPGNDGFRLAENELLALFPDLIVRAYREEGIEGDTTLGFRNEAMLVAQCPWT